MVWPCSKPQTVHASGPVVSLFPGGRDSPRACRSNRDLFAPWVAPIVCNELPCQPSAFTRARMRLKQSLRRGHIILRARLRCTLPVLIPTVDQASAVAQPVVGALFGARNLLRGTVAGWSDFWDPVNQDLLRGPRCRAIGTKFTCTNQRLPGSQDRRPLLLASGNLWIQDVKSERKQRGNKFKCRCDESIRRNT